MSPSVVSGEGDGLRCKGLVAVASRGGLVRIDVGELAETGVTLWRATLTFNGGKHAILSWS